MFFKRTVCYYIARDSANKIQERRGNQHNTTFGMSISPVTASAQAREDIPEIFHDPLSKDSSSNDSTGPLADSSVQTATNNRDKWFKGKRKRSNSVNSRSADFFVHADFDGLKSLLTGKVSLGFGFKRSTSITSVNDEMEIDTNLTDATFGPATPSTPSSVDGTEVISDQTTTSGAHRSIEAKTDNPRIEMIE